VGDSGGVVSGKSFKSQNKKKKPGRGGEKTKLQKKTEIRADQGKQKKVNLGWHRDRKRNPISAPSIHVGALVGAAFTLAKGRVLSSSNRLGLVTR